MRGQCEWTEIIAPVRYFVRMPLAPLIMYERVGYQGRRPSPFSWRIRYALAHKTIPIEYRPARFADVATIERLSGQRLVPILVDGDRVIHDTWTIARYLEDRFPDRPSLFGGAGAIGPARLINRWSDLTLNPPMRRLIYADFIRCLDEGDRKYFRETRELDLGCTLEEACADRPRWLAALASAVTPLEQLLNELPFIGGAAPNYCDYIVFSVFQWARLGSPRDVLPEDSAVRRWRQRMIGLFDGLADMFPAYPQERLGPDGRGGERA
jgi:glutathione S-transferase